MYQEDSFVVETLPRGEFVGAVFDGHAGSKVSDFLKLNFSSFLAKLPEYKYRNYGEALRKTFQNLEQHLSQQDYAYLQGSTACVILIAD